MPLFAVFGKQEHSGDSVKGERAGGRPRNQGRQLDDSNHADPLGILNSRMDGIDGTFAESGSLPQMYTHPAQTGALIQRHINLAGERNGRPRVAVRESDGIPSNDPVVMTGRQPVTASSVYYDSFAGEGHLDIAPSDLGLSGALIRAEVIFDDKNKRSTRTERIVVVPL